MSNLIPDPVLHVGDDRGRGGLLSENYVHTTPASLLPSGATGITTSDATSGSVSTPVAGTTFAAGYGDETELYEYVNSAAVSGPGGSGHHPGGPGSPGDDILGNLPVGTVEHRDGSTDTGPGLPYAAVLSADLSKVLGTVPVKVGYQNYTPSPTAFGPGASQPVTTCNADGDGDDRFYALVSFDTSALFANHTLAPGATYAAYLLLRGADQSGPLGNHLWYFHKPSPPPSASLSLRVQKANDANGDGTYSTTETAKAAGASVPFKATIRNTSAVPVVVSKLTDQWPGRAPFALDTACPRVVGSTLAPGASTTCTFVEDGYAPPAGSSLTDKVTVVVAQDHNASNRLTKTATSTVTTPAAPSYGYLEVCKQGTSSAVTGNATFTVGGTSYTVPVGACTSPIKVPAGTVTITEVAKVGYSLAGVSTLPSDRLVSSNLSSRTATVTVVAGDVSTETVATFTNAAQTGRVKVCEVAGQGVALGQEFAFSVAGTRVAVPAGPAPGGYCVVVPGSFSGGKAVTIAQSVPSGVHVTDIAAAPANRLAGSDLAAGKATIVVGSGFTDVTFTDARSSS